VGLGNTLEIANVSPTPTLEISNVSPNTTLVNVFFFLGKIIVIILWVQLVNYVS
jgi:hypothetical protein